MMLFCGWKKRNICCLLACRWLFEDGLPRALGRKALVGCRGPVRARKLLLVWLATVVAWRINLVRQAGHVDRVPFVHRSRAWELGQKKKVQCFSPFCVGFSSEIETTMVVLPLHCEPYARRMPYQIRGFSMMPGWTWQLGTAVRVGDHMRLRVHTH